MKRTQTSVSCIVSCSAVAVRNVVNYSVNISILCRASWLRITTWWTTSWIRPTSFLASTPGCCLPAERTLTCLTPVSTRLGSKHIWICCWPSARLNLSYLVYQTSCEVQDEVVLTAFHTSVNRIQIFFNSSIGKLYFHPPPTLFIDFSCQFSFFNHRQFRPTLYS